MIWEIFGYIGTILILVSFLIDDVTKLRLVNMIGAIFWIVYGFGIMAKPTIIVNFFVIIIHSFWLLKKKEKNK